MITIADLPKLNAALNATATVLLVVGYVLIKRGRIEAHRNVMLTAFGVSVAFLISYLTYHYNHLHTPFSGPPAIRSIYMTILITHVVLAALVPFLALATIWLGLADRRVAHARLARWTFPIWLYVSITGVVIYVVLYELFPAPPGDPIMNQAAATERLITR